MYCRRGSLCCRGRARDQPAGSAVFCLAALHSLETTENLYCFFRPHQQILIFAQRPVQIVIPGSVAAGYRFDCPRVLPFFRSCAQTFIVRLIGLTKRRICRPVPLLKLAFLRVKTFFSESCPDARVSSRAALSMRRHSPNVTACQNTTIRNILNRSSA